VVQIAFELLVDFQRALREQEQAAADQDQIAPGERLAEHREQRMGQTRDPGQRHQQQDAREHGAGQAHGACAGTLCLRQLVGHDRQENDVVDAKHDLQRCQRDEGGP
jgi:hypothetical protein